jgi:hypothetical protein
VITLCWQRNNEKLSHLFGVCWSPDNKWFLSTIHGGMGFRHAILAIEADGSRFFDLHVPGCRPEISPDGKRLAWTPSDWALRVANIDLTGPSSEERAPDCDPGIPTVTLGRRSRRRDRRGSRTRRGRDG